MRNCMKKYSTKLSARGLLQVALGLILSMVALAPVATEWQASARSLGTQSGSSSSSSTAQTTQPAGPDQTSIQNVEATQAALVTEFDVNGLKVIVKRRPGSLTVSAGLFLRGGSRNI